MTITQEAEWKYMRALKDTLLNRLCTRINARIQSILGDPGLTPHERYLKMFRAIQEEDDNIASAFNDWRRSTIAHRIAEIHWQGLFEPGELDGLTEVTRQRLAARSRRSGR